MSFTVSKDLNQRCFFTQIDETFGCRGDPAKVLKYSVLLLFRNHLRAHFSEFWEGPWKAILPLPCLSNGKISRIRAPLFTPTEIGFHQKCSMFHEQMGLEVDQCDPDRTCGEISRILQAIDAAASRTDVSWNLSCDATRMLAHHLRSRMCEGRAETFAELSSCGSEDDDECANWLSGAVKTHRVEISTRAKSQTELAVDPLALAFDAWSLEWQEAEIVCSNFGPSGFSVPPGFAGYRDRNEEKPCERFRLIPVGTWNYPSEENGAEIACPPQWTTFPRRAIPELSQRRISALLMRGYSNGVAKKLVKWVEHPRNALLSFGFLMELLYCCN